MSGEKSEKPTLQRKKEARREGRIARTPDLGAWGGLLVTTMLLPMVVRNTMNNAEHLLRATTAIIVAPEPNKALDLFATGLRGAALAGAPLAAAMLLTGVATAAGQGGLNFATKLLRPDFKRLNPLLGIKRIFGPHALWEATKITIKTGILAGVLYFSMRGLFPRLLNAGNPPVMTMVGMVTDAIVSIARLAAGAGLVMAAADYAMSRRRIGRQMRMTKQEVKEEHKRSEGDPHVKNAIRGKQMEMSRRRMMSDLEKADLVMVNPTHVAVALHYDPVKGAPRVVAKGAGAVAARIREVAANKRIPMVQDVPLARALYKACDLGQEIPPELYGAVAQVLAFVMTLKARGSAAGVHRNPAMAA
jgi:flagellar biosynthesis protein FlhB